MILKINKHARIEIDSLTGKVTWIYRATSHTDKPLCNFSLFQEIGEWYVQQFHEYLETNNYGINTVDNPDSDYYQTLYIKEF